MQINIIIAIAVCLTLTAFPHISYSQPTPLKNQKVEKKQKLDKKVSSYDKEKKMKKPPPPIAPLQPPPSKAVPDNSTPQTSTPRPQEPVDPPEKPALKSPVLMVPRDTSKLLPANDSPMIKRKKANP